MCFFNLHDRILQGRQVAKAQQVGRRATQQRHGVGGKLSSKLKLRFHFISFNLSQLGLNYLAEAVLSFVLLMYHF